MSAHSRRLFPAWKRIRGAGYRRAIALCRLLRTICLEVRSLAPRILLVHTKRLDQGISAGPLLEPSEYQIPVLNICTSACIRDTQLLRQEIPWATVFDLHTLGIHAKF
jgi:hypothetical protein